MQNFAIYIHYPFCKSKCPYCDFNSHLTNKNIDYDRFLKAYGQELEFFANNIENKVVTSIFFGGGTPSLMPISLVEGILNKISQLWKIADNCEITLEANPTSAERQKFQDLKKIGINRLSLGIQALNNDDLKFLGREHSSQEATETIEFTKKIFDNFSFDLIYARSKQTLKQWEEELNKALKFQSPHLSLYQLTIEKGTRFYSDFQQKKFDLPNENLSADLYQLTNQITSENGLEFYEISNYAKKNFQSKHNLSYWQGDDYIGIGAGAHSRVYFKRPLQIGSSFKNANLRSAIVMYHEPNKWLESLEIKGSAIQNHNYINKKELSYELLLMGLRVKKGLNKKILSYHLEADFGEIFDVKKLKKLQDQGLICFDNDYININPQQFLLCNSIITKTIECLY